MAETPDSLWDQMARDFVASHPEVSFGTKFEAPCLVAHGRAFCVRYHGGAAFKLRGHDRDVALALDGARLLEPPGGRPTTRWVVVEDEHLALWPELVVAALEYVAP